MSLVAMASRTSSNNNEEEEEKNKVHLNKESSSDIKKLPYNNSFQQQTLDIWTPQITLKVVVVTLVIIGIICLPLGFTFLITSRNLKQGEVRYDVSPYCTALNQTCVVPITIATTMKPPIYFYYKLDGFYQNHRRYVKSVDFDQVTGGSTTSDCEPLELYGDAFNGDQNIALRDKAIYPCGVIASSIFRDSFSACLKKDSTSTCEPLNGTNWNKYDIAWPSDRDHRYKYLTVQERPTSWTRQTPAQGGFTLPKVTDAEFMVWMRTASFSTFSKLYSIIEDQELPAGAELRITVDNQYDMAKYSGKKSIVIATTSFLGTENEFLGIAYIVTSCVLLSVAAIFVLREMTWS